MAGNGTVFERVCAAVAATLEVERDEIDAGTCAATLPVWDSLAHLMIINAIERDFGIQIPKIAAYTAKNVGELTAAVEAGLKGIA